MIRELGVVFSVVLALHPLAAGARQTNAKPVTLTATVEAIDKANRVVTLKGSGGMSLDIKAPEQMEGFNNLKVGDRVTATYYQAFAMHVRKPTDPPPPSTPTTSTVRKDRTPGSETRRTQTFVATVVAIDPKAPAITVKAPNGRNMMFGVADAKQLQNLKAGDSVEVTYQESLMIKVERPPK